MDVAALMPEKKGFVAFSGGGVRLDGKKRNPTRSESDADAAVAAAVQGPNLTEFFWLESQLEFWLGHPAL